MPQGRECQRETAGHWQDVGSEASAELQHLLGSFATAQPCRERSLEGANLTGLTLPMLPTLDFCVETVEWHQAHILHTAKLPDGS